MNKHVSSYQFILILHSQPPLIPLAPRHFQNPLPLHRILGNRLLQTVQFLLQFLLNLQLLPYGFLNEYFLNSRSIGQQRIFLDLIAIREDRSERDLRVFDLELDELVFEVFERVGDLLVVGLEGGG